MPTYDFRCPAGHDFERFFGKISDSPSELECPECGAMAVRQISGGAGLLFKGSGFYITDYGKDGKKDQRTGSGSGPSKGGEKAGGEKAGGAGAAAPAPSGTAGPGGDGGAKGGSGAGSGPSSPAGGSAAKGGE